MQLDLGDEDEDAPVRIDDPMIQRLGNKLHQLTWDFEQETINYELNRELIDRLIDTLKTLRTLMVFEEDVYKLDGVLRLHFPDVYYSQNESMIPLLTECPLSSDN